MDPVELSQFLRIVVVALIFLLLAPIVSYLADHEPRHPRRRSRRPRSYEGQPAEA